MVDGRVSEGSPQKVEGCSVPGAQPGTPVQPPFLRSAIPSGATSPVLSDDDEGSQISATVSLEEKASWDETQQLARSIQQAFACVPCVPTDRPCSYTKLLIVGESRSGKSTFIKNLFAAYAQDSDLPVGDACGEEASAVFSQTPELFATVVVVNDRSSGRTLHYAVQDTPGANLEADLTAITGYVRQQTAAYLALESDPQRRAPMCSHVDPRVDIALYFLLPHRLRPSDVCAMVDLSAVVPVIPILAKADSMTVDELDAFRREVRGALVAASKQAGRPVMYEFSRSAMAAAEAPLQRQVPPFAVICSRTPDLEIGRFWPVRSYPSGAVQALADQRSDLPLLKRLLFETGAIELKAATEARYYAAREAALQSGCKPQRSAFGPHNWSVSLWSLALGVAAALAIVAAAEAAAARRSNKTSRASAADAWAAQAAAQAFQQVSDAGSSTGSSSSSAAAVLQSYLPFVSWR